MEEEEEEGLEDEEEKKGGGGGGRIFIGGIRKGMEGRWTGEEGGCVEEEVTGRWGRRVCGGGGGYSY